MKQLILVRHAKSSWANPGQADVERPLNERGLRDAPEMGARIRRHGPVPELVVASNARRALHTAQLIADACGIPRADIAIVDALYEASPATWLATIRGLPAAVGRVLMVGHNPGITEVLNRICPGAGVDNVPTCGVLYATFAHDDWSRVGKDAPHSWEFDFPKNR